MQLKRQSNRSEKRVWVILDRSLGKNALFVGNQKRLADVFIIEESDHLIDQERNFIKTSSFDFLVSSDEMTPLFAVEFDGPEHFFDSEQIRRDTIKNRICSKAGLPLLRITSEFLREYDKTTLLQFICERIVAWRGKKNDIQREIQEYMEELPPEEFEKVINDYDPLIDPVFLFDVRHPFPKVYEIGTRLCIKCGIYSHYIDREKATDFDKIDFKYEVPFFSKEYHTPSGDSEYSKTIYTYSLVHRNSKEVILKDSISFSYRWDPILDVAGASMFEIADDFCEYLALKQIEIWARKNLK